MTSILHEVTPQWIREEPRPTTVCASDNVEFRHVAARDGSTRSILQAEWAEPTCVMGGA